MQITIIQIGKTKHSFITEAEQEYLKRLSVNAKVTVKTLKEATEVSTNQNSRDNAKAEEATRILDAIPQYTFVIALDERGKQFSSVDFAKLIENNRDFEDANLTFIIGGPFGLHKSVTEKAKLLLGFSKFTFTHEMIRVLLLEQIYRAFTIINKKTYHY